MVFIFINLLVIEIIEIRKIFFDFYFVMLDFGVI